jgi:hypothetical protein
MTSAEAMLQKFVSQNAGLNETVGKAGFGDVFWCESLVTTKGRLFSPISRPKGVRKGAPKACFNNAFKVVLNDVPLDSRKGSNGYRYCEGFCLISMGRTKVIDIHHGWVADKMGNAIEVTLPEPALAYFGIPFTSRQFTALRKFVGGSKPQYRTDGFLHLLMPKAWRDRLVNPKVVTVADRRRQ